METTDNSIAEAKPFEEECLYAATSGALDVQMPYNFIIDTEDGLPLNWEDLIINVSFYNNKSGSESFLSYLRSSCVLRGISDTGVVIEEDRIMFEVLPDGTFKIVPLKFDMRFGFFDDKILERALKTWCHIFTDPNVNFDLNYRHGSFSITINNEMAFMKHYPFILKINTIMPMDNSWIYSFTEKRLSDQIKRCFPEGIIDIELHIYNDKIRINNNPIPLTEEEIAVVMSEK